MEEERNNIPEQVKIRKIGVEDNIDKEEHDNILELLKRPWSRDGWRLKDASKNIKGDREIVMAAVRQNGWALRFASEDLRGDRDIVMTAVRQDGGVLMFASDDLQVDMDILMTVVRHNGDVLPFASENLRRTNAFTRRRRGEVSCPINLSHFTMVHLWIQ